MSSHSVLPHLKQPPALPHQGSLLTLEVGNLSTFLIATTIKRRHQRIALHADPLVTQHRDALRDSHELPAPALHTISAALSLFKYAIKACLFPPV